MRRLGLTACATLVLGAMPAVADTIASPPIFGGLRQKFLVCYVFNGGSTTLNITDAQAYADNGQTTGPESRCPQSLRPGKTCQFLVNVEGSMAWGCIVTLPNKTNARGTIEIRDANTRILNRADIR